MFANIIDAIQGPAASATDDSARDEEAGPSRAASAPADAGAAAPAAPVAPEEQAGSFSLWGVASALADSVKKTTADISASVKETDWRAEIEAFGKGVAEDATEVQRHAQVAAREGATRLEGLPHQAAKARLPHVDPEKFKSQLDQVGSTIGRLGTKVITGSKDIFEQVSEAVQAELDGLEGHVAKPARSSSSRSLRRRQDAPKYSRLEAEISAMQRNSSTYCDQPENAEDFADWQKGFELGSMDREIEKITKENAFMAELQSRIVPLIVQYEVFWTRYFYQLDKVKQKHEQRQSVASLAAQAPSEQPAWDDDEDADAACAGGKEQERVGKHSTAPPPAGVSRATPPPLPKPIAQLKAAGDHEEEPDTSTASEEDGSTAPWTVVTSPTHRRSGSAEATSRPPPVAEEPAGDAPAGAGSPEEAPENVEQAPLPAALQAAEPDDLTLELSGDEGGGDAGGEASEVEEEDWGLWD